MAQIAKPGVFSRLRTEVVKMANGKPAPTRILTTTNAGAAHYLVNDTMASSS